jgi:hypothetical protein
VKTLFLVALAVAILAGAGYVAIGLIAARLAR